MSWDEETQKEILRDRAERSRRGAPEPCVYLEECAAVTGRAIGVAPTRAGVKDGGGGGAAPPPRSAPPGGKGG